MLSEKEVKFIKYWENNRDREGEPLQKLLGGLPMALIFSLPIVLSVMVVKIFLPEWFAKISATVPGAFVTIIIAVLLIAFFYSFFRMHYKWEMNEQLYQELKSKQNKNEAGDAAVEN